MGEIGQGITRVLRLRKNGKMRACSLSVWKILNLLVTELLSRNLYSLEE
jgi:hypothetical protein